jgi:hypothetical protein
MQCSRSEYIIWIRRMRYMEEAVGIISGGEMKGRRWILRRFRVVFISGRRKRSLTTTMTRF